MSEATRLAAQVIVEAESFSEDLDTECEVTEFWRTIAQYVRERLSDEHLVADERHRGRSVKR